MTNTWVGAVTVTDSDNRLKIIDLQKLHGEINTVIEDVCLNHQGVIERPGEQIKRIRLINTASGEHGIWTAEQGWQSALTTWT